MQEASPSNYRWIIVAILWLAHVIQFFNFSSLGIFAPFFKEEMNLSSAQVGLFVSAAGKMSFRKPALILNNSVRLKKGDEIFFALQNFIDKQIL